jgi:hypothetical protein
MNCFSDRLRLSKHAALRGFQVHEQQIASEKEAAALIFADLSLDNARHCTDDEQ